MVYSLINASALGYDVVRRPAGAELADVLLAALCTPPVLLRELAAAHPAAVLPAREQREWLAASALLRSLRATTLPAPHPDDNHLDSGQVPSPRPRLSSDLAGFTLGRCCHLDRLIATELLGHDTDGGPFVPTHVHLLAADTFAEAAVTAWTTDHCAPPSAATHAPLGTATTACRPVSTVDLGPHTDRLMDVLAQVPHLAARWAAQPPTVPPPTDPLTWARAMHQATWAAELSGRMRPAAAAQLLAASALARTEASITELAGGLWNAVSGQVAATVVGDLLPTAYTDILTQRTTRTPR